MFQTNRKDINTMETMTLGRRIAQLRKEKELKQDDLAQMLDVSAQAVSKWKNDHSFYRTEN